MNKEFFIEKSNNIGSLSLFLNNSKNIEYLNYLNSNIPIEIINRPISEKIYYFINNIKYELKCICDDHLKFIGYKNGYRSSCGKKECFNKNRKETCLNKYGTDNPKKSKDVLEKEKLNILIKYNGKHYMYDESIKMKIKNTMLDKYGVEYAQQSKTINDKSKSTWSSNINKDEISKNRGYKLSSKSKEEKEEINNKKINSVISKYGTYKNFIKYRQEKIKEASYKKWNVSHHLMSDSIIYKRVDTYRKNIINKIINILPENISYVSRELNNNETDYYILLSCTNCTSEFKITRQLLYYRSKVNKEVCLNCNPILNGKSNMEKDLYQFILDYYKGSIIRNSKSIIKNGELDIYLPELNMAFEFNGLYWHSDIYKDKFYHANKTKECIKNDIKLFHVWEDDWTYKQNIIKSMILNKIGITENKIYARKCVIKEIFDNKLIRDFLIDNHIQGFVGSKVKIGLFYNEELISIMTFGNLRKSLGQKTEDGQWELIRFCNKINTSVIGGASKLLNFFLKNYIVNEIISYSDLSRSEGDMYEKIGFNLSHNSDPNYYYIIDGIRKHRFNFRKDKLVREGGDPNLTEIEIMHNKGLYRIFDCGMQKWIYKKNN